MITDRPMRNGWDERLWGYGIGFMGLAAAGRIGGAIKYRGKNILYFMVRVPEAINQVEFLGTARMAMGGMGKIREYIMEGLTGPIQPR